MSSLGLSTTQEWILGAGLVGIAGVLAYYEYEKSQAPPSGGSNDNPPDLCKGVSQFHIPWWEEVGAVIVTGGLAGLPVAAYEGCKWYESPPGIKSLEGSVKVGIFQGWKPLVNKDDSGWTDDCDNPIVNYSQYSFSQVSDLKRQYKGKEKYLIFQPSDLDYWKTTCQALKDAADKTYAQKQAAQRAATAVNARLQSEYDAALKALQPYPFTESYLRGVCQGAGLGADSDQANLIVSAWLGAKSMYDTKCDQAQYIKRWTQFTAQCTQLYNQAAGSGVKWPPFDDIGSVQPMSQQTYLKLLNDESNFVADLQNKLFAKFPPDPASVQDSIVDTLQKQWITQLQNAKATKQWPTMPDIPYLLNQGLDMQHAEQVQQFDAAQLATWQSMSK